jgi:hypothetical protein
MSSSSNPTRSLLPQTQQQNTPPPTKKKPSFFQVLYNNYYQTLQMQHRNLFSMSKPGHQKPQKVEQLTH